VALTILNIGRGRDRDAFSRCGEPDVAAVAWERLAERAHAASTPWAFGVLARSRAVMEAGPVDALFDEATGQLERAETTVDLARAHVLHGEWLRRARRRLDAREHLRTSLEMFERCGAAAFEEHARTELAASGEKARKRVVDTSDELTPRESQVAHLAASNATNTEIAARLFLSTQTVDHHLRLVFQKLGIASRRQLAYRLEN
jgi:DNA-binding CsgD family transcriptional regulator